MITLSAKSLKVSCVVDGATLAIHAPPAPGTSRVPITIEVAGRKFSTEFSAKSVRKVLATLDQNGSENCVVIVQGSLGPDSNIENAGLSAAVKGQPSA